MLRQRSPKQWVHWHGLVMLIEATWWSRALSVQLARSIQISWCRLSSTLNIQVCVWHSWSMYQPLQIFVLCDPQKQYYTGILAGHPAASLHESLATIPCWLDWPSVPNTLAAWTGLPLHSCLKTSTGVLGYSVTTEYFSSVFISDTWHIGIKEHLYMTCSQLDFFQWYISFVHRQTWGKNDL